MTDAEKLAAIKSIAAELDLEALESNLDLLVTTLQTWQVDLLKQLDIVKHILEVANS